MRLLLINPNTTEAITSLVLAEARKCASPGTTLTAATGRFGARYVASRAAYAIAGHAALDAFAEHADSADGVVLACFGDPALMALKEMSPVPVVGMAEASCLAAAALGGRFAIVTGGERWGPMLEEFVATLGLAGRLTTVRTVAPTGADIAANPEAALALLADACRSAATEHGASSVILGGAGLAGIAGRIADRVPVPLIDGLAASVALAETLVRGGARKAATGAFAATPAVETLGLSPALTRRFAG